MNNPDIAWLLNITIFDVVKWFLVVGLIMYSAFAAIIVRQVSVMSQALEAEYNGLVALFAWAHLAMSILILILALVIL